MCLARAEVLFWVVFAGFFREILSEGVFEVVGRAEVGTGLVILVRLNLICILSLMCLLVCHLMC